jgi:hypothetical protein
MIDAFGGYDHNLRIGEGEFYDMKNMTGDRYPVLSSRTARGVYATPSEPAGLIEKDSLCYVDGSDFVVNGYHVDMGLSTAAEDRPKKLLSMGAYVIIMPDRKYINTMDITEHGSIDASFTTTDDTTFELCTADGDAYEGATVSADEPSAPDNMALWIDTSSVPHTLKKYSASSSAWVPIATTYIRISSPGIGKSFATHDGVKISGIASENLQALNAYAVIWGRTDDSIIVVGMLDTVTMQLISEGAITVERKMPLVDHLTECGNRLWGCRYGVNHDGEVVNEIYASKLGDFKNWNCFMGISTDSYAASCGTDGQFTGAITHLGYPLFFKEDCVHKVYGSYPASFAIQQTACRGVQKGCDSSLAIVNEVLYYKSRHAVCAYDGSLPTEISAALGDAHYGDAVAGAYGNKYYISMRDGNGERSLFVFDTARGLWHKEDELAAEAFCSCRGRLYCISDGAILDLTGGGDERVPWMVESGEIGISSPDQKYVSRLTVRMMLGVGAHASFYVKYDFDEIWEPLFELDGTSLRSFSIPVRPRRCDHLKLRIEGEGDVRIYSITKTVTKGSELS